jgi:site-specific recombinase XerD
MPRMVRILPHFLVNADETLPRFLQFLEFDTNVSQNTTKTYKSGIEQLLVCPTLAEDLLRFSDLGNTYVA